MEMMQKFRSTEESGVSMASRTFILLLTSLPTLQSALILIFGDSLADRKSEMKLGWLHRPSIFCLKAFKSMNQNSHLTLK